jgi:hypothetical protein
MLVIVALLLASADSPARLLPIGRRVVWEPDREPRRVVYRAPQLSVSVMRKREGRGRTPLYGARLTVTAAGRAPIAVETEASGTTFPVVLTAGRWNARGAPYLLVESYTGGAHCCDHVQVVVPAPGRFRLVDLGTFDGEQLERSPADLDGDGAVDFVVRDKSFLYAFSSYAGSFAPPKVLNVVGGKGVDVSRRAGFRSLFLKAAAEARRTCFSGPERNGACAGYVAAAARAGGFARAWAEMLKAHDPLGAWPEGCRLAHGPDDECPSSAVVRYVSYPRALRAFLVSHGYIPR